MTKRLIGSGCRLGLGREMCILDVGGDRRRRNGNFGGELGHPIVTNGDFAA